MPLAVTHVILTIVVLDLVRHYFLKHRRFITMKILFFAGIAGLLPDIDIVLNWFLKGSIHLLKHGGLTHTPLFALPFVLIGVLAKKEKTKATAYVFAFGIIFHLFLDFLLGGGSWEGIMWLYPFSTKTFKIHLLHTFGLSNMPPALDALILIAWLYHEERLKKIKDFI